MIYLLNSDIRTFRAGADDALLGSDPELLNLAEAWALAHAANLLHRFETGPALGPWLGFDPARPYPAGSRVVDGIGAPFYAVQDTPAGTLTDANAYWSPGDNRPPQLVSAIAALTLAHLLARSVPTLGLPTAYQQARDQAQAWLLAQATGRLPAVLPLLPGATPLEGSVPLRWARF